MTGAGKSTCAEFLSDGYPVFSADDYFMEDAETDDISAAYDEFDGDYNEEELRLMKIKFMSEMAN